MKVLRAGIVVHEAEGNTEHIDIARDVPTQRGRRPCARMETFRTGTGRSCVWSQQMALRSAL
jgi:hypothetical protein